MLAMLVHHADALSPSVDFERPLSSRGLTQASRLAEALTAAGHVPDVIWHSGKRRAKQTAEAFLQSGNASAEFRMVRGLRPDDPASWLQVELNAETRDVLLVGHMPHIAQLLQALVPDSDRMPLHGAVVLERSASGTWREIWRSAALA